MYAPRPANNKNPDVLEGLPQISLYLGRCIQTIYNWQAKQGLPMCKMPNGVWMSHKDWLRDWTMLRGRIDLEARKERRNVRAANRQAQRELDA